MSPRNGYQYHMTRSHKQHRWEYFVQFGNRAKYFPISLRGNIEPVVKPNRSTRTCRINTCGTELKNRLNYFNPSEREWLIFFKEGAIIFISLYFAFCVLCEVAIDNKHTNKITWQYTKLSWRTVLIELCILHKQHLLKHTFAINGCLKPYKCSSSPCVTM